MLNDVAGNGGQHQHQQRYAERGGEDVFDLLGQRQKTGSVGPDLPGIGDQVAQRHLDAAADRARKRRQHQRRTGDHEPGVDLLALGDVAALERIVEAFLRRVFCLLGIVALVGHRRGALNSAASGRASRR